MFRAIDAHMHLAVEHVKDAPVAMDENDIEFIELQRNQTGAGTSRIAAYPQELRRMIGHDQR